MTELLTIDHCEQMTARQVQALHRQHVNRCQVKPMTSFGFGQELVAHAGGAVIHTTAGRRILDFTGGVPVRMRPRSAARRYVSRQGR